MSADQSVCLRCHRFISFDRAAISAYCFKCEMVRLLQQKVDVSEYDFTQPVVYRRKKVVKR